jgi:glutathione S-transferase
MRPILYSFRRCPYAIRARLALQASGQQVSLREVVLRDKPQDFLEASPSATVPCLVLPDRVIDESLDVMIWALEQNDPAGWLEMPQDGWDWIARIDGPFKTALDRTKYPNRYPGEDPHVHCDNAAAVLEQLNTQITDWLFDRPTLADFAILPFIRQFAFIDKVWFDTQPWPRAQLWLDRFLNAPNFVSSMEKYDQWAPGADPVIFPTQQEVP